MKWIAAKVTFDSPDRDLATDLVADIFYAGPEGCRRGRPGHGSRVRTGVKMPFALRTRPVSPAILPTRPVPPIKCKTLEKGLAA
jgi:hypothetical protein